MPTTTIFTMVQDRRLEDKVERLLLANGLNHERGNAKDISRNPYGIACLVTDFDRLQSGGLEQGAAGLAGAMPTIVITPQSDVAAAVQAIKQGAFDVLESPLNERALLSTVLRALEQCRQANRTSDILESIRRRMAHLTAREAQILQLLVVGKTNKEVALKLAISVRTVEIHRAHVMEKMKARNMPQLVRMVIAVSDRVQPSLPSGFQGSSVLPLGEAAFM